MANTNFKPESLMMSYGYKPGLSEGSLKCPIFQTSTFVFNTAEEGKAFFEVAYGYREQNENEEVGLIYSRINNPNLEILENRLCQWDNAEDCAVFESGMSAITTTLLEFLKPGDLLLHSGPLYGGADHFMKSYLTKIGVHLLEFNPGQKKKEIIKKLNDSGLKDKLAMIYIESPANPTNDIINIKSCVKVAQKLSTSNKKVIVAVDNTYLGPLWQNPIKLGADLVLYSATKYIGGHSDLVAGACLGSKENLKRIKSMRNSLGGMAGPWTAWLLMRSLETLKIRMNKQMKNAKKVARFLKDHPAVEKVYYLGFITKDNNYAYKAYKNQCLSPGAMISFDIKGGEKEAFVFLNSLQLVKLAVSLGSTETLAEHPLTMTHSNADIKGKGNKITDKMIRLSIGIENAKDLISDLDQALQKNKMRI